MRHESGEADRSSDRQNIKIIERVPHSRSAASFWGAVKDDEGAESGHQTPQGGWEGLAARAIGSIGTG